jgi:DNA-binding LytR/AlgR family response regulator
MAGLRTLIVDDEPIARNILREELEQIGDIGPIEEAEDCGSALSAIRKIRPDLVFLDLQMPGGGGFEVIRRLPGDAAAPVIVIVTAYDEFAIQAFDAGAIDYVLKPVGHERLVQAVERAVALSKRPVAAAEQLAGLHEIAEPSNTQGARRIVARDGEEYLLLRADEVFAFEAEGDIVWIVTARKRFIATQPLKHIQEKLRNSSFRRIHRNALVNLDHVRKMSALSSQRWLITLNNSREFIVSKRQARSVRELLSW